MYQTFIICLAVLLLCSVAAQLTIDSGTSRLLRDRVSERQRIRNRIIERQLINYYNRGVTVLDAKNANPLVRNVINGLENKGLLPSRRISGR